MPAPLSRFRFTDRLAAFFFIAVSAYGIARSTRLRWMCDDAFISFRYALNLARGDGLVFNAGEYVEGFTNLLWTLLLSPFFAIDPDVDITAVAAALGIICYGLMLLEYFRQGRKFIRTDNAPQDKTAGSPSWIFWPWTLPAVAAHHHLHVFATSGLETPLFTLLITAGVLRLVASRTQAFNDSGAPAASFFKGDRVAFILLALACVTRPDGLLIYGLAAIFVALETLRNLHSDTTGQPALRRFFAWVLAELRRHAFFGLVVGGSFVFRFFYYGELLPNTFYAKSAHDPYVGQGFYYAGLYFAAYWVALPLLAVAVFASVRMRDRRGLPALLCCAWIAYVIWVGGDFMFGRFLVPITPLLYFAGEIALRNLYRKKRPELMPRAWWIAALVVLFATVGRYDPYRGRPLPVIGYVGEEYKIYTKDGMRQLRETAIATRSTMQAADPIVAFVGAQAALIFYWDITTAIESQTGLTDRKIARLPLEERGWIGHEKNAPLAYLRERNVAFILRPPPPERRANARVMEIEGLIGEFEIIKDRPEVMEVLKQDSRFRFQTRTKD
ncbi:MAG: hypothetical protein NXI24_00635 [bacterium]|nr:hypothetical protein [bacterium]